MNEISGPEKVAMSPVPGWPLGQVALDAFQQFWGQNQTVAKTLVDLNARVADFVGQRFSQDSEVVVRMAQCKSLPEVVGVETEWFRRAFDDYAKEANKLMEANGKLFGCFVATTEQAEPNASPLKRSTRAAG
jgi:hypothetical protein